MVIIIIGSFAYTRCIIHARIIVNSRVKFLKIVPLPHPQGDKAEYQVSTVGIPIGTIDMDPLHP